MKSAANTEQYFSLASTKAARLNDEILNTILKPKTQESDVPCQHKKLSRAQQRLTDRHDGVENILRSKPPKLPETQKANYRRVCGTQNELRRESTNPSVPKNRLPRELVLGKPPPKPARPPSVDIHRFRRNLKFRDGPQIKMCPVAPPLVPPRLPSCPSADHAAALNQQLYTDDIYDDVDIMDFPHRLTGHPSKRREGPIETIVSEEIKGQNIITKTNKRNQEAKKKFKMKGSVQVIEKRKSFGGNSDLYLNQGRDDLKEEEETGPLSKSSAGAPVDVYRVYPLPQPNTNGDDVYDDIDGCIYYNV
ncbi:FYN-binding protein 1-like [Cottoperca gobio]|uniref:FYN-binding protein 1-like n=1 Tax=Cottoperca gobio TaxID=56716 RepID=A0A6J2QER4_COTGO|nr:FYN-binding protein 1-like [Cottoperca gobio]